MTPRPSSHADRSRSRSLIRRESSGSGRSQRADSPVVEPPVPELPNKDSPDDNEASEAVEETVVEGQYGKSPLLTTHRPSVVSEMSMDEVSLDEGTDSSAHRSCDWGGGIQRD